MKVIIPILLLTTGLFVLSNASADDPSPYAKKNNSWISISGTVDSVAADHFNLDYGKANVTVEMDDGDFDADGYKLIRGDKVTVYGRIDDDMFEQTSIEASSVYVENAGMFFYSDSTDEEDYLVATTVPVVISTTVVQGPVKRVAPNEEEFTIKTPSGTLTVECDTLAYNPLDDKGFQKIDKGDRVSVTGSIDEGFFGSRELEASSVITLKKAKRSKDASNES